MANYVYAFHYDPMSPGISGYAHDPDLLWHNFAFLIAGVLEEKFGIRGLLVSDKKKELWGDNLYEGYVHNQAVTFSIEVILTKTRKIIINLGGLYLEGVSKADIIENIRISAEEAKYLAPGAKAVQDEIPTKKGGCYVATAVYGSYDCPEVWTLRRFRDYVLAKNIPGRAFIKVYYAISPTIVAFLGETKWFKQFWKCRLDRLARKLNDQGYADTPYEDD